MVCPVCRSWTKTSSTSLVSPLTRLLAQEQKATYLPSAEMEGSKIDQAFPWLPSEATETRVVVLSTDFGSGLNGLDGLDAGMCPFNPFDNPLTASPGGAAVVGLSCLSRA